MSLSENPDAEANDGSNPEEEVDIQFTPIVKLAPVVVPTMEEEEEELLLLRAKLFRFDAGAGTDARDTDDSDADTSDADTSSGSVTRVQTRGEWKERGVGNVKLLKHKKTGNVRLVMRRDQTLKLCANHYVSPLMELRPSAGSNRAWLWSTPADFSEEEPRAELLAIRFANSENASKFKAKFDEAKAGMTKISLSAAETPGPAGDGLQQKAVKEEDEVSKIDSKVAALSVTG